ncbi:hypothetical protein ACLOJK_014111 [Asimina triloba]
MSELSAHEPLLNGDTKVGVSKRSCFSSFAKWALKIVMWTIFVAWIAFIFFYPSEFVEGLFRKWIMATRDNLFGTAGSIFLLFSAPILIVVFLAYVYVAAFPDEDEEYDFPQFCLKLKKPKFPRFRLWTFPVLVDGLFGVVSAAELIGILLFSAYVIWALIAYSVQIHHLISEFQLTFKEKRSAILDGSIRPYKKPAAISELSAHFHEVLQSCANHPEFTAATAHASKLSGVI